MKAGRRVRWTFEVSADVGEEKRARKSASRPKPRRAKPSDDQAEPPDPPSAEPIAAAPSPIPEPPPLAPEPIVVESVPPHAAPPTPMATAFVPPPPPAAAVRRATRFGPFAIIGVMVLVLAALAIPSQRPSDEVTEVVAAPETTVAASTGTDIELIRELIPVAPITAAEPRVVTAAAMKPAARDAMAKPAPARPDKTRAIESPKPAAPIAAAYVTSAGEVAATDDSATKTAAESGPPSAPAPAETMTGTPVTITGCLEISVDEDAFRLTDTEGLDVPKARSWRTGFLTKRSAAIALTDLPDRRAMQTQVGKRVSATGRLTNHELKVSSVRVVRSSCN